MQESFGLTPIEAMAAGLPVIVSDWDGYRDAVRDGEDGFVIPTIAPPLTTGLPIADRYFNALDNYGEYLTAAAQSTAVDIQKTAAAIHTLADNPALRRKLGQNGQTRAADIYDWRHIIKAYAELWADLGQRRRRAPPPSPFPDRWQAASPAYPNPYAMFASFPTDTLKPETRLRRLSGEARLAKILAHEMNCFVPGLLLEKPALAALAQKCAAPQTVADLAAAYPAADRDKVWRSCGWLLKFGICEIEDA